jgi:hypothetical protein
LVGHFWLLTILVGLKLANTGPPVSEPPEFENANADNEND